MSGCPEVREAWQPGKVSIKAAVRLRAARLVNVLVMFCFFIGFPPISGVGPELQNRPLSIQTDFSGRGCGRGPKFLLFHMLNERRYAICLI